MCGLALLALLACGVVQGQESIPEPARAFTPKTALAIYLDLERSSQSGIWKALESRLGPLQEQLSALPQVPRQFSTPIAGIPDLRTGEVVELAIAIEGENAFQNLETEQYDPDFGVVGAVRFKELLDQPQLISQLFDEAEKQQPGIRGKLEESHDRVGAVDWYELPPEAFAGARLPFPLRLAVGPGRTGTILGVGKADSLRRFVAGETDGRLPSGIAPALSQRGQMWLYFPVPSQMIRELSAGAGGDNPMMAGLSQGLEKVREFGLGLSFGNSAIGIELALGCQDTAAASELQQGLQQFIGMMQMMTAQDPSAPKLLARMKTATAGTAFRLTTEVTMQDVELALKSSGLSAAPPRAARSSPDASAQPSLAPPASPVAAPPPVSVEFLELIPGEGQQLRYTRLRIENRAAQPVKEIRVTFNYWDRNGRNIGKWTRRHQDPVSAFLAPAKSTREIRCPTFHVPSTTERVTLTLHEVEFADDTKWIPG